ncbi:HAMP domain-containing histidine kinase [Lacisediminihabitans sp. G11-30]|uniref:histidine kinase n=1 Tax=Lacisediminihabitans changchengi TaxID=2787634 RepID=A0A934VYC0_9MICO|nr:HAMP domain-containing histidine kinase [Lacisediminihabitans changchengi]MBK4347882.1 HAMP domain-containing histidine kinase [Lacisediminihabitans changchengi]
MDADARAVRRAARVVGAQITVASAILVIGVLVAALVFVLRHIPAAKLFDRNGPHETTIDIGGIDILMAGIVIGVVAILLAAAMSIFATRRAVRPLGDALRSQRAFVADASHELRTPLAVLDARLQLLQRGLTPQDRSTEIVSELRQDAKTLIEIVNDLLVSAEAVPNGDPEPVAVNPVAVLAVNSMRVLAADKHVTISLVDTTQLSTMVPPASIHRCLVALLDNALDFAPPGSTVTVSLTEQKGMARLAVRDEGAGIQGIEPARIFDRFARSGSSVDGGGTSRTGFGIGLSLVRDTVERVGGRATVSATSAQGTEIELLIPLAR